MVTKKFNLGDCLVYTKTGKILLGKEPLVYHCNHYNLALQQTLITPSYLNMKPVLVEAAIEAAYSCISNLKTELGLSSPKEVFDLAKEVFRFLGFGIIDFSQANEEGGEVVVPVSHYGLALIKANKNQTFSEPQSFFDLG
ncbi:MAG: hypothetical protein D6785_00670, partial [Planctomycetota bacterium]